MAWPVRYLTWSCSIQLISMFKSEKKKVNQFVQVHFSLNAFILINYYLIQFIQSWRCREIKRVIGFIAGPCYAKYSSCCWLARHFFFNFESAQWRVLLFIFIHGLFTAACKIFIIQQHNRVWIWGKFTLIESLLDRCRNIIRYAPIGDLGELKFITSPVR